MAGAHESGGVEPATRKQTSFLFSAVLIALPIAFVGLVAIAPRLPKTAPAAPNSVFALPFGRDTLKVVWRPPNNGGSTITSFRVTPYRGFFRQPTRVVPATAGDTVFTGLTTGKPYRFEVTAVNAVGTGPVSKKSIPIIVGSPGEPARPTVTTRSSGSLTVAFAAPDTAGAPISKFTVTCASSDGGATRTASGNGEPLTVAAVTVGRLYACTVRATNSRGTGPGSSPSDPMKSR